MLLLLLLLLCVFFLCPYPMVNEKKFSPTTLVHTYCTNVVWTSFLHLPLGEDIEENLDNDSERIMGIENMCKLSKDVEVITCTLTSTYVKISGVHQYWYCRMLGWIFCYPRVHITLIGTEVEYELPPSQIWYVPMNGIWANQPIHSFLVGCLNPCLQGTSVWVGSPRPNERGELAISYA